MPNVATMPNSLEFVNLSQADQTELLKCKEWLGKLSTEQWEIAGDGSCAWVKQKKILEIEGNLWKTEAAKKVNRYHTFSHICKLTNDSSHSSARSVLTYTSTVKRFQQIPSLLSTTVAKPTKILR